MADNIKNLKDESERDRDSAGRSQPVDPASCFRAKIEEHDNKKKKHHHRARINEHLNDADEIGIKRHEERGEAEKRNDETERARHGIAVDDHSDAEDQHQQREYPE